jgi:hypothetical protein
LLTRTECFFALVPITLDPIGNTVARLEIEACAHVAQILGLSREEISAVVGEHRTSIGRSR